MKLGIDLSEFTSIHQGGKDEVAYNLLRGFRDLGYEKNVICFCSKDLVNIIKDISPEFETCIIPVLQIANPYAGILFGFIPKLYQGMFIKKKLKQYNVDVLMYTNKMTPWMPFNIPTAFIPHDIQVFMCGKIPGLHKYKSTSLRKLHLRLDFFWRNYIIAISDYDMKQMGEYMPWARHKIKRIYNPICFKNISLENNEKQYISALNIQWVHKNIKTLIGAYSQISCDIPYDLLLIGRKPDNYDELCNLIAAHGIQNRVHFTGYVTESQLTELISKTRIYVNPSLFEGFGMTAVEMMERCIPTIVAATTANPEVTQGLCRYYEPADNMDALAKEIIDELTNPTSEKTLENISKQMRQTYSYIKIASEYWDFLNEICKKVTK